MIQCTREKLSHFDQTVQSCVVIITPDNITINNVRVYQ